MFSASSSRARPCAGREIADVSLISANPQVRQLALGLIRAFEEGYPDGGRIARHAHDLDQLALITGSAAIMETDALYVVHPLLKALWLPAGVEHSVYSPRHFVLHSLYFPAGSLRSGTGPEVLGLDNLTRELVLFLCAAPRASQRDARHENALALLGQLLPLAKAQSFSLPRPATRVPASSRITLPPIRMTAARWKSSSRKGRCEPADLRAIVH